MRWHSRPAPTDVGVALEHHRLIAPARGSFQSGNGRSGTWTGAYRLEEFSSEYGQLTATGVFTGHLGDAGSTVLFSSSRHTCAVTGAAGTRSLDLLLGPLDVRLSGLLVHMDEVQLPVDLKACRELGGLAAPGLLEAMLECEDLDPSIILWLSRIFAPPPSIDRRMFRSSTGGGQPRGVRL